MVVYGYRFNYHMKNKDFISHWGFKTEEEAQATLDEIVGTYCRIEGDSAKGEIYMKEEKKLITLRKYRYSYEDGRIDICKKK